MAGPVLNVELPGPVPDEVLARLALTLARLSSYFEEERRGAFDVNIAPASLGVRDSGLGGDRPFVVLVNGAGFGGEDVLEAEHADHTGLDSLLGFVPTHEVAVLAMTNGETEHLMTAELTAMIQDLVGGLVNAELYPDQLETVRALPGVVSTTSEPWTCAVGTAEFLRAWAMEPGFRLVK